jgi:mannose-6-phosphate isomerase-like protein (cupin superfamily)
MRIQVRDQMKGGKGSVTVRHMVECDDQPNVRFLGEMTIPQGASIGDHEHGDETEYYLITDGIGMVLDGGEDQRVGRGDVIVTGGGQSHRIRNLGGTPLKITALIVTH